MKRHRREKPDKQWQPAVACLIGIFIILAVVNAYGATYNLTRSFTYPTVQYDSVRVEVVALTSAAATKADTLLESTFPDSVVLTLDEDTAYQIRTYFSWVGYAGYHGPEVEYIPIMTQGVLSIGANDSIWVKGGAIDTNRTEQGGAGSGTYTVDVVVLDTLGGTSTAVNNVYVDFQEWGLSGTHRDVYTNVSGVARIATDAESLAVRVVKNPFYGFPTGWDSMSWTANYTDTVLGYLDLPSAAASPTYVLAYIDIGSGMVDSTSGNMIARDKIELRCNLVPAGGGPLTDGNWVIVPKEYRKRPDTSGRANFIIPSNDGLTPVGSYYELYYRAFDGSSVSEGIIKRFVVDSLTDPINILDATEVWN